jgi:hypothetical protein
MIQPQITAVLLKHGGTRVSPQDFGPAAWVAEFGRLFKPSLPVLLRKGGNPIYRGPSRCFDNISLLWLDGKVDAICIGYGLSDDGLWRPYGWAVKGIRKPKIIETTMVRELYFGVPIRGEAATCWSNGMSRPRTNNSGEVTNSMNSPTKVREFKRRKKQEERRAKHRKGRAANRKLPPATVHLIDHSNV